MEKSPLVSVLICTYNAENYIAATLASVIDQTYKNIEILVLDNNSHDKTVNVVLSIKKKNPNAKILLFRKKKNLGPYGGLNFLLDAAKGKYIAVQDHDDIWHPLKIAEQVKTLEKGHEFVGCGTGVLYYYEKLGKFTKFILPQKHDFAYHMTILYRNTGKKYDLTKDVATDTFFVSQILCNGKKAIYNSKSLLAIHRIRSDGNNLSSKWIRSGSFREIFSQPGFLKKIYRVYKMFVSSHISDYLSANLFQRKNTINISNLKKDPFLKEFFVYLK